MISEERRWKANTYLAETDLECAELEGDEARKKYLLEMATDRVFLTATGGVREREAIANTSGEVQKAHEDWVQALVKFKHMKAKRQTESGLIEQWRSEQANRRQAS